MDFFFRARKGIANLRILLFLLAAVLVFAGAYIAWQRYQEQHRTTLGKQAVAEFTEYLGDFSASALQKAEAAVAERFSDEAAREAPVRVLLGDAYLDKGRYEKAGSHYRQAVTLYETLGLPLEALAARVKWAQAAESLGDYQEARLQYGLGMGGYRKLLGDGAPLTLAAGTGLTRLQAILGSEPVAVDLYREILRLQRLLWADDHPDILETRNRLARLLLRNGDLDEAGRLISADLEALGSSHTELPEGLQHNLALALRHHGDTDGTLALLSETYHRLRRNQGPFHAETLAILIDLADQLQTSGRGLDAEAHILAVLNHEDQPARQSLEHIELRYMLGRIYQTLKRPDEAQAALSCALADRVNLLGPNHPDALRTEWALNEIAMKRTGYEKARPAFKEILARAQNYHGYDHRVTRLFQDALAGIEDAANP
ncbi:MAG: tetratricopeptide repeat protein [Acidobacteriota bacterium]|nr:tetratricopeptide repeat protein [Acidobacteriota bacterium]